MQAEVKPLSWCSIHTLAAHQNFCDWDSELSMQGGAASSPSNECHFVQEYKSKELKEGLMSVTNSVLPPGRIFWKRRTFYKHYLCLIPVLTKVFKWAEVWSLSFHKGWEAGFGQGLTTSFRKLLTYYETKIQGVQKWAKRGTVGHFMSFLIVHYPILKAKALHRNTKWFYETTIETFRSPWGSLFREYYGSAKL